MSTLEDISKKVTMTHKLIISALALVGLLYTGFNYYAKAQETHEDYYTFKGQYYEDKQAQEISIKQKRIWMLEDRYCNGNPCAKAMFRDAYAWEQYRIMKDEVIKYYKGKRK